MKHSDQRSTGKPEEVLRRELGIDFFGRSSYFGFGVYGFLGVGIQSNLRGCKPSTVLQIIGRQVQKQSNSANEGTPRNHFPRFPNSKKPINRTARAFVQVP